MGGRRPQGAIAPDPIARPDLAGAESGWCSPGAEGMSTQLRPCPPLLVPLCGVALAKVMAMAASVQNVGNCRTMLDIFSGARPEQIFR